MEKPSPSAEAAVSESIVDQLIEESADGAAVSGNGGGGGEAAETKELPEELSRSVMVLTCEPPSEGGSCDVYLVGTARVSQESCKEVGAVINFLKPQVPTVGEMIEMWRRNHNMFEILCSRFLAEVADELDVFPGSEFCVAFEEAIKYGGKVILGDQPIELKEMDVDMLTLLIQEMSKQFPTLMEILVHKRDQSMLSGLLQIARQHTLVVAVVGKGHLQGIKKHWKQPVAMEELLEVPQKPAISTMKIVASLGVAVPGVDVISGIYLACKASFISVFHHSFQRKR